MTRARYHGLLYGADVYRGGRWTFVALPKVALASVDGIGLVTASADTAVELDGGAAYLVAPELYSAPDSATFAAVRAVYYLRRRPSYGAARWRHAVRSTRLHVRDDGRPVFLWTGEGRAAVACQRPPGDFICDG